MTEAEWLACTDPKRMLEFLADKASDRKLRLFAVACCRWYWHLYGGPRMQAARNAVRTAEQFADAQATEEELIIAAEKVARLLDSMDGDAALVIQLACTASEAPDDAVGHSVKDAARGAAWGTSNKAARDGLIVPESQAVLLREIFNPFKPANLNRSWLNLKVVKGSQAIYKKRTFDRVAVLADALEEAGCTDADILSHLRAPGQHVRGCWPVDLLLGKE